MMTEKDIKCPICGTKNENGAESCKLCKTHLTKKDDGSLKVKSPKSRGKTITIVDIEDPLTRKKLEELTLIPGVTRKKALMLYQSGIHSIEDFLQKAFHGEKLSENYSRTVANKLLVRSLKRKDTNAEIPCPSCNAPNPMDSERCNVCNFDIKKEMDSVNLRNLSGKLSESVSEILTSLNESQDFEALPEDMKAQLAAAVDSDDIEFDMEKPKEMDTMGIENLEDEPEPKKDQTEKSVPPDKSEPDIAKNEDEVSPAKENDKASEPIPEKEDITKAHQDAKTEASNEMKGEKSPKADKKEKIRKILTDKMVQWRKSGYDVAGLEEYLEDVEGFKIKAKEVLGNGKTIKTKCLKQMEMWKAKGFDVSELEPLLENDIDAFTEKAKDVLKKQKKK